MTSFHELFGSPPPIVGDALTSGVWKYLQVLDCSYNQLESLDECLVCQVPQATLTSKTALNFLRRLDASHNKITSIQNLQFCYTLEYVDLGFNQITSIEDVAQCLGNVRVLILAYNALSSLSGIEVCPIHCSLFKWYQKMLGLEKVDLKKNLLSITEELSKFTALPFIEAIWLKGNPFAFDKDFRKKAYVIFNSEKILLDGKPPNDAELDVIKEHRQNTSATIKVSDLNSTLTNRLM